MSEESKISTEVVNEANSQANEASLPDPEMIRRMASLLSNAVSSAKTANDATTPTQENKDVASAPKGDLLSALLSDPSLLQRLPQIIAVMKPLLAESTPPPAPDAAPTALIQSEKVSGNSNRDRLLLSLKPFLSPSRCEAIDTMLRLARLGEVFGQFK